MRNVVSISETLKSTIADHKQVRAHADAQFDENEGMLVVRLSADDAGGTEETVRIRVAFDEALPAAKEVFRTWVKKLAEREELSLE